MRDPVVDSEGNSYEREAILQPSRPVYDRESGRHVYRASINMSSYNSSSNPCFLGHCLVRLKNKTCKRVDQVQKGDILHNGAKVVCVVKTNVTTGRARVVRLSAPLTEARTGAIGDLHVTPWHPVYDFVSMSWSFPIDLAPDLEVECKHLYSFLLDSHYVMEINDIPCVTLGHSFTDRVRKHPFFGSQAVVQDLARFPGFEEGVVETSGVRRSLKTGLVNGFRFSTSYSYEDKAVLSEDAYKNLLETMEKASSMDKFCALM